MTFASSVKCSGGRMTAPRIDLAAPDSVALAVEIQKTPDTVANPPEGEGATSKR
jgi:hypothetical protein